MSELIITNMDESLKQRLMQSAGMNGITPSEEAKNILDLGLPHRHKKPLSRNELIRKAEAASRKAGPQKSDSVQIIREDRDSR